MERRTKKKTSHPRKIVGLIGYITLEAGDRGSMSCKKVPYEMHIWRMGKCTLVVFQKRGTFYSIIDVKLLYK